MSIRDNLNKNAYTKIGMQRYNQVIYDVKNADWFNIEEVFSTNSAGGISLTLYSCDLKTNLGEPIETIQFQEGVTSIKDIKINITNYDYVTFGGRNDIEVQLFIYGITFS